MSELSTLERVVLYSLGDADEEGGANFASLLESLEANGAGYQQTRRDYYIAGLPLPTESELRDTLQRLRERGYVMAEGCEICGVTTVGDLRDAELDEWETNLLATRSGVEAALPFRRLVESDQGQTMTVEFVRHYINEKRASLRFDAVVPSFIRDESSVLADLDVLVDQQVFTLRYRIGTETVSIEQTAGEFPDLLGPRSDPTSTYIETSTGVQLAFTEYQLTSIWVRLRVDWRMRGLSNRVVVDRTHGLWGFPEWTPASLDDSMREEARKVVSSMIEQVHN
jgi:hypothetical protein